MQVLVVGAGGQLGRDLVPRLLAEGHSVTALSHAELDIADRDGVLRTLRGRGFARLVNCAAYTKVDEAEKEPELAFRVNRDGPAILAGACAEEGISLCHVSTDFVFGQNPSEPPRPWTEDDLPQPRGVYAESKRAGELACLESGCRLQLVRTSWLFGGEGPNFPLTICRVGRARDELKVVADQVGTPTWTGDLATALVRLLDLRGTGVFHLSGSGSTTWYHFAQAILEEVGIAARVRPATTAEWGAPAPRPRYSVLENRRWRKLGMPPLPAWQQGLVSYVAANRELLQGVAPEQLPETPG